MKNIFLVGAVLTAILAFLSGDFASPVYSQNSFKCDKAALCKNFWSECGPLTPLPRPRCNTDSINSAIGCRSGDKPCAMLDTGTTCAGRCSVGNTTCTIYVWNCGNPE